MREFLEKYIHLFFSVIVFGGLLWGAVGLGQLVGKDWNIVSILLRNSYLEGAVYILIGLCTMAKALYNLLWDRPSYPPHLLFIIFSVVIFGAYWGVIGTGLLFGRDFALLSRAFGESSMALALMHYTIGIFALIKLFNYIFEDKRAREENVKKS